MKEQKMPTLNKAKFIAVPLVFATMLTAIVCLGASSMYRHGEKMQAVSIVELIANPDKFDGQRVLVQGFVRLEFEGTGLYLHEEDYRHGLRYNAVGLNTTSKERDQAKDFDLQYCTIIGTYHAVPTDRFGLWSGSLSDVKFASLNSRAGHYQPAPEKATP